MKNKVLKDRENGFSLGELAKKYNISKSTASLWCKGIYPLDKSAFKNKIASIQNKATNKARQNWLDKISLIKKKAKLEWPEIKKDPELMGFLGLYWGEGRKAISHGNTNNLALSNNNPNLIKIVYSNLSKLTKKTIAGDVRLYNSHNYEECKKFWFNLLPNVKFTYSMVKDKRVKILNEPHERCLFGNCTLRVNDFELWHKIVTWIDCWAEDGSVSKAG